jgi:hypothetical protein
MKPTSILFLLTMIASTTIAFPPDEDVLRERREKWRRECLEKMEKTRPLFEDLRADPKGEFLLEFRLDRSYWSMTAWSPTIVCVETSVGNKGHERIRDLAENWHRPAMQKITATDFIRYLGGKPADADIEGSCTLECRNRR